MSRYTTSFRMEGPFGADDPIAELVKFYRTNGFTLDDSTVASLPDGIEVAKVQLANSATRRDQTIAPEETGDQDETENPEDSGETSATEQDSKEERAASEDRDGPTRTEDHAQPDDEESPAGVFVEAKLTRGKKGSSIWSSNMAELHAVLTINFEAHAIVVEYDVETTLQHLTEDDKQFWTREASKAEAYLQGRVDAVIDWRENESIRVDRQQRDIVIFGVQMMIVAAIIVGILYFSIN